MKEAARQFLRVGALAALIAQGGCAELKKNLKDHHPMEHHFGHVLFNESAQHFPALRPAGASEEPTPAGQQDPPAVADAAPARKMRPLVPVTPPSSEAPEETVAEAPREVPVVPRRPKAPKATTERGLAIEPAPADPAPAPAPVAAAAGLGDGTRRGEALAAARRLVGVNTEFDEQGFLTHLLQVADISLEAAADEDLVKALYDDLNKQDRVFGPSRTPEPGDVVFFSNTYDRDDDGRADDWFTMAGVVERIDGDGTVQLIGFARGEIRRLYMNLQRPSAERNESSGKTLNSVLREKRLTDRPFTRYHAGELFASYGSLQ